MHQLIRNFIQREIQKDYQNYIQSYIFIFFSVFTLIADKGFAYDQKNMSALKQIQVKGQLQGQKPHLKKNTISPRASNSLNPVNPLNQKVPVPQLRKIAMQTDDEGMNAKPPALNKDEYAIFIKNKYIKFKTKKYEGLELDMSCFTKSIKPVCKAYEFSQIRPKNLKIKNEAMNNFAALTCESVFGSNLLALDFQRNDYNFCRFDDGSMVNSWSLFYKHFPKK